MQHKILTLALASSSLLLLGQAQELLNEAYAALSDRNYSGAKRTAQAYLNQYGRTYKAEFIRAASNCRLYPSSDLGMRQMTALKKDYALSARALSNVNEWLNFWCKPTETAESDDDCNCSVSSGLGSVPSASAMSSATTSEPSLRPLPQMSTLQYSVSYSGDDYGHYDNVASADACAQICRMQAPCRSMTYITSAKVCWLKRSKPAAMEGSDFISAYKIFTE